MTHDDTTDFRVISREPLMISFEGHDLYGPMSQLNNELTAAYRDLAKAKIEIDRLYEREHLIAETLQLALMPGTLPRSSRLTLSAAYAPASASLRVGGDWYDAFSLVDGRMAISIGDVVGHGIEAAATMGQVRMSMRALAAYNPDPRFVIRNVGLALRGGNETFVTAIFGIVSEDATGFEYTSAGHPPPILASNGNAEFLPGGGLPLGVDLGNNLEATLQSVDLGRGDAVILYTDGIVEQWYDVIGGSERLLHEAAIQSTSVVNAEEIRAKVMNGEANRDDVAILCIRVGSDPTSPLGVESAC